MRVLKFVGCKHCVGPAHLLVKTHSWACLLKPTKSALWFNAKLSVHGKVWLLLVRSDAKLPKSACHSLGNDLGVWDTLKLTEQKKEGKQKAIRPCRELKQITESHSAILVWVPERAKHRKERASARGAFRKIERNTVRVWESEKEKWDIFLCSSYTQGT